MNSFIHLSVKTAKNVQQKNNTKATQMSRLTYSNKCEMKTFSPHTGDMGA